MSAYNSPYDTNNSYTTLNNTFNGSVTASVVGHIILLLLIVFGIPFVAKNPEVIYEPIPVEIISSADLDSTKPPVEEAVEEPAPPPVKRQPPQMIEETPPEPVPEPVIEDVIPEPKPPPPPIETPESEVKEEIEPEKIILPTRKPKPPPPKQVEKPKEQEKPKQEDKSNALNKLLNTYALKELEDQPSTKKKSSETIESRSQSGIPDGVITFSEEEKIKAQMAKCWRINSGGAYAENLRIEIRLFMRPDRTIIKTDVLNERSDTAYQAAKSSALRALRNPKCVPLDLPPSKYNEWKQFKMVFDPKEMLTYQ